MRLLLLRISAPPFSVRFATANSMVPPWPVPKVSLWIDDCSSKVRMPACNIMPPPGAAPKVLLLSVAVLVKVRVSARTKIKPLLRGFVLKVSLRILALSSLTVLASLRSPSDPLMARFPEVPAPRLLVVMVVPPVALRSSMFRRMCPASPAPVVAAVRLAFVSTTELAVTMRSPPSPSMVCVRSILSVTVTLDAASVSVSP